MKKPIIRENIKIEKIVGGGQGLGELASGKKIFAWNALKDEVVNITLTKKKSSLEEGIVTEVREPSKDRITPKDPDSYLSTSPWQILDWQRENILKATELEVTKIKNDTKDELGREVKNLAAELAEKIIKEKVDDNQETSLIDKFIAEVGEDK